MYCFYVIFFGGGGCLCDFEGGVYCFYVIFFFGGGGCIAL